MPPTNRPDEWRAQLQGTVVANDELSLQLSELLSPTESAETKHRQRDERQRERRNQQKTLESATARATWVADVKANPDRVRHPQGIKPGELTNDRYWLMEIIEGEQERQTRARGAEWKRLRPEFGEDVARAYRDAALSHWRAFRPGLGSEGADVRTLPYSLLFGLGGLEIETAENPDFPAGLDEADVRQALRYVMWERNGLPFWTRQVFDAHPDITFAALWREIEWELGEIEQAGPIHYVLHDIVAYAPWLHDRLARKFLEWLSVHDANDAHHLHLALQVLHASGTAASDRANLARNKLNSSTSDLQRPVWYALWVDTAPGEGIVALSVALMSFADAAAASQFAQEFVVALCGSSRSRAQSLGAYRTPEHLKAIFVLMQRYIPASEDTQRANQGAYSPGLRDDAQDARDRLFRLLTEIAGKATYSALKSLAAEHPEESHRGWMSRSARERAITDSDEPAWSETQIRDFATDHESTPSTHRQLYELGVSRIKEFKRWLEQGNDSPAQTYQRVEQETEMRNLVAGWLNQRAANRYTCAQENELANAQRPDIFLQRPGILGPVPIELKLLDKTWTGPRLCERLKNQLAGDYLRDQHAGCGIMLLIWQGRQDERKWKIDSKPTNLAELSSAMKAYWQKISSEFPNVEAIEIIVVDLTVRALRSQG